MAAAKSPADRPAAPTGDAALYLELDGWEGPLDLLLDLARRQKVDLKSISILALVDQYIAYIEQAEALIKVPPLELFVHRAKDPAQQVELPVESV